MFRLSQLARRAKSVPYSCGVVPQASSRCFSEELVPFYDALEIPKEAAQPEKTMLLLDKIIIPVLAQKEEYYLGYQTNHQLPPIDPLTPTLEMHLNNAGDPFISSSLKTNTKTIERAVLRYCAELWGDVARNDENPNDPENFWGYVLNMGSTEGNLNALWNAREYMEAKSQDSKDPIVILSKDAHYSLDKAAKVLRLETATVPTDEYSRVDRDALLERVNAYAAIGQPIVAVLNMGTTFAGAYDDHTLAHEIHQIAQDKFVPCWVHMDGALGGFIAPFIESGVENGSFPIESGSVESLQTPPHFGFDLEVQSCNASFYKWFGAPYPCGIFMTQNKYLRQADTPDYIGSPDTTLGGGRNAFAGLYMWYSLCLTDYGQEEVAVASCVEKAKYLKAQLDEIDTELGRSQLSARRSPYSMSVTFNAPSQDLLQKYSIPNEYSEEFGQDRSHIYTMKHVDQDLLDTFVADLRENLAAAPQRK